MIPWRSVGLAVALVALLGSAAPAQGAKHTPEAWRQPVTTRGPFFGQLKHVGWLRDRNANFIDDLIDQHYVSGDSVNVVLELNERVPPDTTSHWLTDFGTIVYYGKLISCVYVRKVPFDSLDHIAQRPEVAMVVLQGPTRPGLDVANRAVGAVSSVPYPISARTLGTAGYTGKDINIAIVDDGIADDHPALSPGFRGGHDATSAGIGTTDDPEPDGGMDHGTHMAGYAIARPQTFVAGSEPCRTPADASTPLECSGVAPEAGYYDVKGCRGDAACMWDDEVMAAIDWVGMNVDRPIHVASISLFEDSMDDGTHPLSAAVNYLAALGIVPVVCHGNAGSEATKGELFNSPPGAASFALTVAATKDNDTITRSDDDHYRKYRIGPRDNPPTNPSDVYGFKPDLSAPGQDVISTALNPPTRPTDALYFTDEGSSVATALTAGAVALILEKNPYIDPASVKDLLQITADKAQVPTTGWDEAYGKGFLDVATALSRDPDGDVRFDNCGGIAGDALSPCPLKDGSPSWDNEADITTDKTPKVGESCTISAKIYNDGPAANAVVTFRINTFGAGERDFTVLGSQSKSLVAGLNTVTQSWTPTTPDHQCIKVQIAYGADSEFRNNTTQRNVWVAPSEYPIQVDNPFMKAARFRVAPISRVRGWIPSVDREQFEIGATDGPRRVQLSFHAPRTARPGQSAKCDVSIFGMPVGSNKETLIGGVTVQTYVPVPCLVAGRLLRDDGSPIPNETIRFERDLAKGQRRNSWESARSVSDADGYFCVKVQPDVWQLVTVGRGTGLPLRVKIDCGGPPLRLMRGSRGLRQAE